MGCEAERRKKHERQTERAEEQYSTEQYRTVLIAEKRRGKDCSTQTIISREQKRIRKRRENNLFLFRNRRASTLVRFRHTRIFQHTSDISHESTFPLSLSLEKKTKCVETSDETKCTSRQRLHVEERHHKNRKRKGKKDTRKPEKVPWVFRFFS